MKNFVEAYREARAKEWKYMDAKRAGWAEPGKRTRENHAILVPRREAMEMADELAANIYARELYIPWAVELRGFMERLAREAWGGPGSVGRTAAWTTPARNWGRE